MYTETPPQFQFQYAMGSVDLCPPSLSRFSPQAEIVDKMDFPEEGITTYFVRETDGSIHQFNSINQGHESFGSIK